ncbi:MAG: hypothetical protein QNK04_28075 [Myxococcota bacterium]|nr:hypothetical protein [Myxococcota bacterium]
MACAVVAGAALAAIESNSTTVTQIVVTGTEDFSEGGPFEGNGQGGNTVYAFDEAQGVAISNLTVDLTAADLVAGWAGGSPTNPTQISGAAASHYLHLDAVNDVETIITGFVEFEDPVIAVIVTNANLIASDGLVGSGGMTFAPDRFLGSSLDQISIPAAGSRRLDFTLRNVDLTDQVRVLTAPAPAGVPALSAPGLTSLVVAVLAVGFAVRRRRPRWRCS